MHIRSIQETELNGMKLRHTQTLPEILYKGCVICFINFDGDIKGVGTRITDLKTEEFQTFKTLINMIDFEIESEVAYAQRANKLVDEIQDNCEFLKKDLEDEGYAYIYEGYLNAIRGQLAELDFIAAKLKNF